MRGRAAWVISALLITAVQTISATPTRAQINDATAAFNAAVRQAQKIFSGQQRQRKRKTPALRATIAEGARGQPDKVPPPQRNPQRGENAQQATRDGAKEKVSAGTKAKAAAAAAGVAAGAGTGATSATTAAAAEPKPDVWSPAEVKEAMQVCQKVLKRIDARVIPVAPVKAGPCGDPAPVKLARLNGKHPVVFKPAPVVNCRMVKALGDWVRGDLQPLAARHLGAPITTISVMSSYSCRNAYGRKDARLSEHGRANALDIGAFETADGARTDLLAHWGPTERDIIAQARAAADEDLSAAKGGGTHEKPAKKPAAATVATTKEVVRKSPTRTDLSVKVLSLREAAAQGAPGQSPTARSTTGQTTSGQTTSGGAVTTARVPEAGPNLYRRPVRRTQQSQDGIDMMQQWYRNPAGQAPASPVIATAPAGLPPDGGSAALAAAPAHPPLPERRPSLRQRLEWAKAAARRSTSESTREQRDAYRNRLDSFLSYRNDLGGPGKEGRKDAGRKGQPKINRAAFLREAHRTACRIFGTVLGPEANEAHRNHFHVDLAPRKRSNYCR